jgi:RNA polymerase sigma-70 factor (ECF subfamily)
MNSLLTKEDHKDDSRYIKRLMDAYGNDVLRTSFMYLKDKHKAEDAFQEVFIRIFKKRGGFLGNSSEKTWIIRITINVCKDMLRSSWLKRVLITDKPDNGLTEDVEDKAIEKDENRQLYREVTSLPPQFKDVVILYYYHGFSTPEIAKTLDVAEGTVRSRLARSREILKDRLRGRIDFNE